MGVDNLYHYTSIDAMRGILGDKELWLSNVLSMNDSSECSNFINRLIKNLKTELDSKYEADIVCFANKIKQNLKENTPFVGCFSKLEDNAAQWERYADNAKGVCIEFDRLAFEKMIKICGGLCLEDIEYRYNIKKHDNYNNVKRWIVNTELPAGCKDEKGLISNIIVCSYFHKHKSFSTEEEVRVAQLSNKSFVRHEFKYNNGIVKELRIMNLGKMCDMAIMSI